MDSGLKDPHYYELLHMHKHMVRTHRFHQEHKQTTTLRKSFTMKILAFGIFVCMLAANVIVFAQSVSLSDKIVTLETETRELQKENARLEQKVFTQNSLSNLKELAQQLGFTKEAEPIHLDANEFALVP